VSVIDNVMKIILEDAVKFTRQG